MTDFALIQVSGSPNESPRFDIALEQEAEPGLVPTAFADVAPAISGMLAEIPLTRDLINKVTGEMGLFTRLTSATYWDSATGLLKTAAMDEPRFEKNGMLVEGASTNLLTHTSEYAMWAPLGIPVVTANTDVAPDGTLTADTIQDNDAVTWEAIVQATAITTLTHTASIYIKKDAIGRATRFAGLQMQFSGSTIEYNTLGIDTLTGEINISVTTDPSATAFSELIGEYWRVSFSITSQDVANTGLTIVIYPALGASASWAQTPSAQGSIVIWGSQVEALPFVSSYIPTTTVAVTRAADSLTYQVADNLPTSNLPHSIAMDFDWKAVYPGVAQTIFGVEGEVLRTIIAGNGNGLLTIKNGITGAITGDANLVRGSYRAGYTYDAANLRLFTNGVLQGLPTATTGATGIPTGIKIGSANYYGHIKNIRIFNRALSETELADEAKAGSHLGGIVVEGVGQAAETVPLAGSTVSRATTGTFIDATTGLLTTAGIDALRYERDPVDGVVRALIEGASTNLCPQSQDLTTSWAPTNATVTADATVAPDGTTTADEIVSLSADVTLVYSIITVTEATQLTVSCYVKNSASATDSFIQVNVTSGHARQFFDVTTGTLGSDTGTISVDSASMESVGSGWYRVSMTLTTIIGDTTPSFFIGSTLTAQANLYVWGAQLEEQPRATSYIPTTTAAVTRAADMVSLPNTAMTNLTDGFTLEIEAAIPNDGGSHYALGLWEAGAHTLIRRTATGQIEAFLGGVAMYSSIIPNELVHKYALRTNGTTTELLVDGVVRHTVTSAIAQPTLALYLGSLGGTSGHINSHQGALRIWPRYVTDAELAAGDTIPLAGFWPSRSSVLQPGNSISFNGVVRRVVSSVDSDAAGVAIAQVSPPLMHAPNDYEPVTLLQQSSRMISAGLAIEYGLQTAVIMSLFTDRWAEPGDLIPDGSGDRRGFWGDAIADVEGDQIGSRLWLLDREKQTPQTLNRAREYAEEALQWMIEDGVAESVNVAAEWVRTGMLSLSIEIVRPDSNSESYRFDNIWEAI